MLSVNVSAELEAVIGCWGTDRKCPSWQESTEEERRDDLSASFWPAATTCSVSVSTSAWFSSSLSSSIGSWLSMIVTLSFLHWLGEEPGHCDPGEEEDTDTRMLLW